MNAWFALGRRELQLNTARKRPQQHTAGDIARWKVGAGTHKTSGHVNRCRAHWKTQSPHPPPMATYSGITCEHTPQKTARGKRNRARVDGVIYLRVEPNLERSAKRSGHVSSTCSPEPVQADVKTCSDGIQKHCAFRQQHGRTSKNCARNFRKHLRKGITS